MFFISDEMLEDFFVFPIFLGMYKFCNAAVASRRVTNLATHISTFYTYSLNVESFMWHVHFAQVLNIIRMDFYGFL